MSNSTALKKYHACARRNSCGKKYTKSAAKGRAAKKKPGTLPGRRRTKKKSGYSESTFQKRAANLMSMARTKEQRKQVQKLVKAKTVAEIDGKSKPAKKKRRIQPMQVSQADVPRVPVFQLGSMGPNVKKRLGDLVNDVEFFQKLDEMHTDVFDLKKLGSPKRLVAFVIFLFSYYNRW